MPEIYLLALEVGHAASVLLLLKRSVPLELDQFARVIWGFLIHIAARAGSAALIRLLITQGADVNEHDGSGCTLLREASCMHGT